MDARKNNAPLIEQYLATRDTRLREEIILQHIPLVHYVLGRLGLSQSMGRDYEDAASQGLLGLIEALDRFDPKHGAQFTTYATLRIRGKVIDHLRELDWLPRGARRRVRMVQDGISLLWEKLQRFPSDVEVASYLNIDLSSVHQAMIDESRAIISLDATVLANDDDEVSLHELLADESLEEPCKMLEEHELRQLLIENVQAFPQREQLILSLYYLQELTFKEIGMVLRISESRVCQLHGRILMKLRARLGEAARMAGSYTAS
jgi:RNA polymerase sigma factor for flagellar operon FliA